MINHARNLLVNYIGNDFSRVGEEVIDPKFRPVVKQNMPSAVVVVRSILFGKEPDAEMLNYRAAQYLRLIHGCELAKYITELDTRITYDLTSAELLDLRLFAPTVSTVTTAGANLAVIVHEADSATFTTDKLLQRWRVSLTGVADNTASTTIQLFGTPIRTERKTVPISNASNSALFKLTGSTLYGRFMWSAGGAEAAPTGEWLVNSRVRPSSDFSVLEQSLRSVDEALIDLFSRGSAQGYTEPFATFYELWTNSPYIEYRIGAVVLALIYKMNELV